MDHRAVFSNGTTNARMHDGMSKAPHHDFDDANERNCSQGGRDSFCIGQLD